MPDAPTGVHVFTTRMPKDEYEVLRAYAFFINSPINDVVLRALRRYLAEHANDPELDAMIEQQRTQFRQTVERLEPD